MFQREIEPPATAAAITPRCVVVAIEDDEMRRQVSTAIELDRHHVIQLEDGAELADYFELLARRPKRISRPDLVVAQLELPGVTGLAVLLNRRTAGDTTPFVFFVDGSEGTAELHAAYNASALLLPFPGGLPSLQRLVAAVAPVSAQPQALSR